MARYFISRDCCPSCLSQDSRPIYSKRYADSDLLNYLIQFYGGRAEVSYIDDADYILNECGQCRLIYQKHIPNDLLLQKLYDEWIDPEGSLNKAQEKQTSRVIMGNVQEMLLMLQHFQRPPRQIKVLDFGMGWGYWCFLAQGMGFEAYGAELAETRIAHAQSLGVKLFHWGNMPEGNFDFINTEQVFEHLTSPLETLQHLRRGLSPTGIVKISVPNGAHIKEKLKTKTWDISPHKKKSELNAVAPLEHLNCFTHESLIKMAASAGLRPASISLKTYFNAQIGVIPRAALRRYWQRGTYLLFSPEDR
ncbi:MAG: class I SAM-dependent methyltransferase [Anaerolineae bacterium]|nr:class I SAM-dependent methyltransferase [Anaerolineae bacterium]